MAPTGNRDAWLIPGAAPGQWLDRSLNVWRARGPRLQGPDESPVRGPPDKRAVGGLCVHVPMLVRSSPGRISAPVDFLEPPRTAIKELRSR